MTFTSLVALALTGQAMTLSEALARAESGPALEAARSALARRRELAAQVPWLTNNPQLQVQPGARALVTGGTGFEAYLGLSQELNLAGYGTSRQAAALAEVGAAEAEALLLRRRLRLETAARWLSLWAAQAALARAQEERGLAADLSARVQRGAQVGGLTRVDVAVARTYLAEAELAVLSLEGEVFVSGVAVNRVLGLDAAEPARAEGGLPALSTPDVEALGPSVLAQAGQSRPVRQARAARQAEEAHDAELAASRGTGLQVGALGWREGTGDVAAVATLQLTVPLAERAQRERSSQVAQVARARGQEALALSAERADRLDALHEVTHSAEVLAVLEEALLPAASEAVEALQRRFEAGEATVLEVVVARRTLAATRARQARAQADVALARFRLEELRAEGGGP